MITKEKVKYGTEFKVNGIRFCILTPETPDSDVQKFMKICESGKNPSILATILTEYEVMVRWNHNNQKDARDWPIFNQRERLVNRLLKEAGIKDS